MDDIDLSDYKVTSEVHIFSEGDDVSEEVERIVISNFKFTLPPNLKSHLGLPEETQEKKVDEDGDIVVQRKNQSSDLSLAIRHHIHTSLDLVGLQVWRGALLLADFLLHSSLSGSETGLSLNKSDHIIELGAGTGLTSVAAAMVVEKVTSTDINKGNILSLIETNAKLNSNLVKGEVKVCELNFYKTNYPQDLMAEIETANIIIAADVVYHDDLTDAFLATLKRVMLMGSEKVAFISLEKRFVFTVNDMDVGAPCFDYFYENLLKEFVGWRVDQVDTSKLPQYFCYERPKELVLFKVQRR